jgi:hypothetical protein
MSDEALDLAKVAKKVHDTYALLSQLALSHEMLKINSQDSFNEFINKIASSNQETSKKFNEVSEGIKKSIQEFSGFKNEVATKHRLIVSDIKDIKECLDKIIKDQNDLKMDNVTIDKKVYALHSTSSLALNANIEKTKKELNEKINALPIPKDAVNIDKVNSQFEEKIEPTRREVKTATSTIQGHEIRLMLLEKKIENALAQLKTIELSK